MTVVAMSVLPVLWGSCCSSGAAVMKIEMEWDQDRCRGIVTVLGWCNNEGYPRLMKGQVSARLGSKCWSLFLTVLEDLDVL